MKLHEYQAKDIFRKSGIAVPESGIAKTDAEAIEVAKNLNGPPWIVKAQVHAGARGKSGGVLIAHSLQEIGDAAANILDNPLVTNQTCPLGIKVRQVLIEERVNIDRELYLAIFLDRSRATPVMIFGQTGGMDVEKVAEESPELLLKQPVSLSAGWLPHKGRTLAYSLKPLPGPKTLKELMVIMGRLYEMFVKFDCVLAEINPLAITKEGRVIALDAKMKIDDNALIRQKEMAELEDLLEKDPLEVKAQAYHLNYIRLGGNIGCMVNGAGLAMATMDMIKHAGAEPANFLDVGGGASEEMITRGLEIILEDENVKGILINIFGGILRCDVLAKGILAAAEKTKINVPLIIRLEGTNVEKGRKILKTSGLKFLVADSIANAASMVKEHISLQKA
jgi:succinyl-CoA synthetase beta subunit